MASDLLHGPRCSCTPDTHAQCTGCDKTEDIEKMKKCPRCSVQYCSGDCMKSYRKKHQQQCAKLAEGRRAPKRCDARPYTAICFQNFLWDRSEKETFEILRDVRRMNMEDEKHVYVWDHDTTRLDKLDPPQGVSLRRMLELVKNIKGFLPPWWTDAKAEECAVFGEQTDDEFKYTGAWEEDYMNQYRDPEDMPYKLRLLGQAVGYICTKPLGMDATEAFQVELGKVLRLFTEAITELMAGEGVGPEEMMEAMTVYGNSLRLPD